MTPDDLDAIRARAEAASEGPWEVGDRYHIQGASHCTCAERYGPLVWEGRYNINGQMMQTHIHRRDEPLGGDTSIYGGPSPSEQCVIALSTTEYVRIIRADAEFIAHARSDIPALVGEVERVKADADRLAATLDRVREMADTAPPLMTKSGYVAGIVSASAILAAIEGTDS